LNNYLSYNLGFKHSGGSYVGTEKLEHPVLSRYVSFLGSGGSGGSWGNCRPQNICGAPLP